MNPATTQSKESIDEGIGRRVKSQNRTANQAKHQLT